MREDIRQASQKMRRGIGGGRQIRCLAEYLWAGELVTDMARGSRGRGGGILVLTDRRLLFVLAGHRCRSSEDLLLRNVSSVEWAGGMVLGRIIVHAAGDRMEIAKVNKRDGRRVVDLIQGRLGPAPPAPPPELPADPVRDDRLRRIAALREAGVLSREEFEVKIARLLRPE
ncbi:hypothetical protein Franean1_0075 [Parafrankia sp. EAN1pec]|uniref:PH domain-containing protein n=1 Tax=Parafrankia sp. (strain EAN1pec) TaxID=298653 RepID=UPI0000541B39|nr:hypothetical protein Franean1_0075 [Frankia sp. EAN1pec]